MKLIHYPGRRSIFDYRAGTLTYQLSQLQRLKGGDDIVDRAAGSGTEEPGIGSESEYDCARVLPFRDDTNWKGIQRAEGTLQEGMGYPIWTGRRAKGLRPGGTKLRGEPVLFGLDAGDRWRISACLSMSRQLPLLCSVSLILLNYHGSGPSSSTMCPCTFSFASVAALINTFAPSLGSLKPRFAFMLVLQ